MSGTGIKKKAFVVKWSIENIQSWLQKRDDTLYSPQFLAETLTNTRWKLSLSPNWHLAEKYASLALQRDIEDDGPEQIALNYELSFLACDGSPLKSKICSNKFASKTISHELNVKQVDILEEEKERYLPEGILTVCCKLWNNWSATSKEGQCSVRSFIGTKCLNLKATIHNFSPPSTVPVNFMPSSTDISLISLDVYVSHDEFLFKTKHVECKNFSWYSYKLFALDVRGRKTEFDESINFSKSLTSNSSRTLQSVSHRRFYSRYLPKDRLTLQLDITYNPGVVSECTVSGFENFEKLSWETTDLEAENSERDDLDIIKQSSDEDESSDAAVKEYWHSTTLKEDLTSLYNERFFSDTKLLTDSETFPAHKNILSARSPVFKKMFMTDMKERAGECINVPDISPDIVRRMLQFIYTDCPGDLEMQSAKDLYIVSDKYDIASLKQRCSSFMKDSLRLTNVCEVLVLADMHQDKDLKSAAQEFVLTYDKEVFASEEWKLFMKNFSSLAAQVMYLNAQKCGY